jgi:hypothetical protein
MKAVDWVVLVLFGALSFACYFLYDKAYSVLREKYIDSTEIIQHRFDTTIERIKTIHNEKTIYIIAIPDSAIFTHLKIELSKFDTNGWKKNVENYEQP